MTKQSYKNLKNSQKKAKVGHYLRVQLTQLAARIMYEEGVDQFYDAKRIAAKRLFRQGGNQRFLLKILPSNGEISEALASMANLYEGDSRAARLFAMRVVTLELMDELDEFMPRLIGSVSTGKIRKGSDIDLHVFTDDKEMLAQKLHQRGRKFERREVEIRNLGKMATYTHFYFDHYFPVELSVYPVSELRVRGRSSTDGKAIVRLKKYMLSDLIMHEHPDYWADYLETGNIVGLQELPLCDLESVLSVESIPQ